jgi:hypothetical protein
MPSSTVQNTSAIVDEHQVFGRQCQFIAAARRSAIERRKISLAGMLARVLDGVSGLVRELAEIHFVRMTRDAQHADVGAGTKHGIDTGGDHDGPDFGMPEAQSLHCIVELDIDADVVGIQLQFVAGRMRAVLIDRHDQPCNGSVDGDRPVPVLIRRGPEIELRRLCPGIFRKCMHYSADICYD